jgi:hypothetical protein
VDVEGTDDHGRADTESEVDQRRRERAVVLVRERADRGRERNSEEDQPDDVETGNLKSGTGGEVLHRVEYSVVGRPDAEQFLSVGGSVGAPSSCSSLNMNAIRSSLVSGWHRTARRSLSRAVWALALVAGAGCVGRRDLRARDGRAVLRLRLVRVNDQPAAPQFRERHVDDAFGPAVDNILERRNDVSNGVTRSLVDMGRLRDVGAIRELDDDARLVALGGHPRRAGLPRTVLGSKVERQRLRTGDFRAIPLAAAANENKEGDECEWSSHHLQYLRSCRAGLPLARLEQSPHAL